MFSSGQRSNHWQKCHKCKQNQQTLQNHHGTRESQQNYRQMWQTHHKQCQSREPKPKLLKENIPLQFTSPAELMKNHKSQAQPRANVASSKEPKLTRESNLDFPKAQTL